MNKRYTLREVLGEEEYTEFLDIDANSISDEDLFENGKVIGDE